MREKIILVCEECLSRNYQKTKNKLLTTTRLELKKFCPRCNKMTLHKETKQEAIFMAIKEKQEQIKYLRNLKEKLKNEIHKY